MVDAVYLLLIIFMTYLTNDPINIPDFASTKALWSLYPSPLQKNSFSPSNYICSQLPHSKLLIIYRKAYRIPNISTAASVKSSLYVNTRK